MSPLGVELSLERAAEPESGAGGVVTPGFAADESGELDVGSERDAEESVGRVELVDPAMAGWLPSPSMAVPAATVGFVPADVCAEPCASAAVDSVPSVAIIRYR